MLVGNCGFAAGLAMAVALYRKHRTGETSRVRTSLSAVTNLAQIPFAFDYEGRGPFDEPSGREALGNHELSHFYPTADGWIFIDSQPSELDRLEQVEGLEGITPAGIALPRWTIMRSVRRKPVSARSVPPNGSATRPGRFWPVSVTVSMRLRP